MERALQAISNPDQSNVMPIRSTLTTFAVAAMLCACAKAPPSGSAGSSSAGAGLQTVAKFDHQVTGVTGSRDGRIFRNANALQVSGRGASDEAHRLDKKLPTQVITRPMARTMWQRRQDAVTVATQPIASAEVDDELGLKPD